jgi:hypothetical protein
MISHSWVFFDQEEEAVPVKSLTIESLGPQDDDLRVDIDGVIVSNTKWNVTSYKGDVKKDIHYNNSYAFSGFRKLTITYPNAGAVGSFVEVFTTDVGGECRLSEYMVSIVLQSGEQFQFKAGRNLLVAPPMWPTGTIGDPEELWKTGARRPWEAPGSPPIYVPNGSFYVGQTGDISVYSPFDGTVIKVRN